MKAKSLSHVQLFATPWTVAYQDPLSMGFSKQEYWSGFLFPSPGDPPNPEENPGFPGDSDGKASAFDAGNLGSISGSERSPGERKGNPLQYSCLEDPVDRGSW